MWGNLDATFKSYLTYFYSDSAIAHGAFCASPPGHFCAIVQGLF